MMLERAHPRSRAASVVRLDIEEALRRLDDARLPMNCLSFRDHVQRMLLTGPQSDGARARGLGGSSQLSGDN